MRTGAVRSGKLSVAGILAFVLVVASSSAAAVPAAVRGSELPPEIAAAVEHGAPGYWLRALQAVDSTASASSFAAQAESRLIRVPWARALRSVEMRRRATFGVLISSPDSTLVLDPLTGYELDRHGGIGADPDLGFSLFLRKSGDRTFHWASTSDLMVAAAWVDSARVMIVGWSAVDLSRGRGMRIEDRPAIWVVDASAGRMVRYLGPHVPEARLSQWRQAVRRVRELAYPKVRGEWP